MFWAVLGAALAIGALAAWHYAELGLTLSHYDARAHLVVSRRITDSLTPGWRQIGAVWLPLPHLLGAIPALWDWSYRTGAGGVALSCGTLAWGLAALARYLTRATGSLAAACTAPLLILLNPNVLYLQGTPMTEPLLIGVALLALAGVGEWLRAPTPARARVAGWALAALVLTRYEGWLIAAALTGLAQIAGWRLGLRGSRPLWLYPFAAVLAFFVLSWASTGRWVLSADFYVPDDTLRHQIGVVFEKYFEGARSLGGPAVLYAGGAGLLVLVVRWRRAPQLLLPVALLGAGALPLVAFYQGHPYRVRYLLTTAVACAVLSACGVGALPRRVRAAAAVLLCAVVIWARPPFALDAPMVVEAQWETPFRLRREAVTQTLRREHDGSPILASMGSLAHYMQETAHAGFPLRTFLHEGNGDLWLEALKSPRRSVRWVLIEARAEGGDLLAARARADAGFLDGFEEIAEGGGLQLFRRLQ